MYRENESGCSFLSISRGLRSFIYCELISALVVLLINIPLSLSVLTIITSENSQMY
jgi:hypothetical protein